jgi:hypothetical protein
MALDQIVNARRRDPKEMKNVGALADETESLDLPDLNNNFY